jgi:hypothetical protein
VLNSNWRHFNQGESCLTTARLSAHASGIEKTSVNETQIGRPQEWTKSGPTAETFTSWSYISTDHKWLRQFTDTSRLTLLSVIFFSTSTSTPMHLNRPITVLYKTYAVEHPLLKTPSPNKQETRSVGWQNRRCLVCASQKSNHRAILNFKCTCFLWCVIKTPKNSSQHVLRVTVTYFLLGTCHFYTYQNNTYLVNVTGLSAFPVPIIIR